ncbi:MAG: cytochrome c family protein [Candidatus Omnitrophica bacterium]|nr:cytochrome c family protein [Candidatus Omnitrophota bacterium]
MKKIILLGLFIFIILNNGFTQERKYVGMDKCKACHPKNYEAYSERKFSKSWQILQMREKTKDPECLKCHTTGFGEPSGFVSEEQTPHLKYKQCEACHGPGSLHANNPGNPEYRKQMAPYKYGEENPCLKCHVCMRTHRTE